MKHGAQTKVEVLSDRDHVDAAEFMHLTTVTLIANAWSAHGERHRTEDRRSISHPPFYDLLRIGVSLTPLQIGRDER
jgi:hypothetical protein